MPRKTGSACAACRKAHRSEAECASGVCAASAARAERCQSCRRARRSAAECKQRHPADLAAAQAGAEASQDCRGLEGTDGAARSGDEIMASPNKEMQKDAGEECTTVRRKKGARCAACRQAHRSEEQCAEGACAGRSGPCVLALTAPIFSFSADPPGALWGLLALVMVPDEVQLCSSSSALCSVLCAHIPG